jgi:hypothetical protein
VGAGAAVAARGVGVIGDLVKSFLIAAVADLVAAAVVWVWR